MIKHVVETSNHNNSITMQTMP